MKRKVMLACGLVCGAAPTVWAVPISLTTPNVAYMENFNTLATSGTTNPIGLTGWEINETGGGTRDNEQYAGGDGSSGTGDTYSFGTGSNTDRALGSLASGSLVSQFGAVFTNNTGQTITSLKIDYVGEQWRRGDMAANVLTFAYNENTSAINSGTFTPFGTLDFTAPIAVPPNATNLDGNENANRTVKSATIDMLNIPVGQSFAIRWSDFNDGGADDGLAVDDFSLTPNPSTGPLPSPFSIKLPEANQKITVDFTGFQGAGFTPVPGATQLDSDNWRVLGSSDGPGAFGGTHLGGDFARGLDNDGGVTTGGIYAFNIAGDVALGFQPAGSDLTDGQIDLLLPNETLGAIDTVSIMYDLLVLNNGTDTSGNTRSNLVELLYSTDGGTVFQSVVGSQLTSPGLVDANPAWVTTNFSFTLTGLGLAPGANLILRWNTDDVSGAGSRDEFAIDNIMVSRVVVVPEPATLMLLGLLAPAALRRRARR